MRIPYFYIIEHIKSGRLYAGCKIGNSADPKLLLSNTPDGYLTSSNLVKSIIKEEGLSSFKIVLIDTVCNGEDPLDYETQYLEKNNAKSNPKYLNGHNNKLLQHGSNEFKEVMLKLYGVEHYSQHESYTQKKRKTSLSKHNDETYNNRQKAKETTIEKYGVEHYTQTKEYMEKCNHTCLEKYGVEHHTKLEITQEKKRKTNIEKYGVPNVSMISKNEMKFSNMVKEQRRLDKIYTCQHCNKQIKGKLNFNRWHNDNCKLRIT